MKFVALVSGGKDSCFNILHCLSNGHELVALGNLYPVCGDETDEIDSFMFQTVGYNVLTSYEKCIGVPMYRRPIEGLSKNVELQYEKTLDDETEDLYALLCMVKEKHPDVEAVSVGAILSTYQRTRVEYVCERLQLVSLSYLWQRDQDTLMQEMCGNRRMDARILKVAAYGLNSAHLGLSLAEMYPILAKLHAQFDVHVCGEGGEFETIVLDAPFFVRSRLVVVGQTVVHHSTNDVYYLKLDTALQPKETHLDLKSTNWAQYVTLQPLLSPVFSQVYQQLASSGGSALCGGNPGILPAEQLDYKPADVSVLPVGNRLYISNISAAGASVEEQTSLVLGKLVAILQSHSIETTRNVLSTTLLVSSMADFASINSIYRSFFPHPLPPARTCVETVLPKGVSLAVSCVALREPGAKMGLHVQGRSYWAPANIGPYSQAGYDSRSWMAHLAGQIPLVPASMELASSATVEPDGSDLANLHALQTALSLKHIVSVKDAIGCKLIASLVCYVTKHEYIQYAVQAFQQYNSIMEHECLTSPAYRQLIVAKVLGLPKNAPIEWSGISYKTHATYESSSDEASLADAQNSSNLFNSQNSLIINSNDFVATLCFFSATETASFFNSCKTVKNLHHIVFCKPTKHNLSLLAGIVSKEIVPCLDVFNYQGKNVEFAVIVRGSTI